VGDPGALEAVLQGLSRAGVNTQLWRPLNIHQQRQENHLRRVEQAGTWRARGPPDLRLQGRWKRTASLRLVGVAAVGLLRIPLGVESVARLLVATETRYAHR